MHISFCVPLECRISKDPAPLFVFGYLPYQHCFTPLTVADALVQCKVGFTVVDKIACTIFFISSALSLESIIGYNLVQQAIHVYAYCTIEKSTITFRSIGNGFAWES